MHVRRHEDDASFLKRHALGLVSIFLLALWIVLYIPANPGTHLGGFYGNAIADWSGTVVAIYASKYLYEIGSSESRKLQGKEPLNRTERFIRFHSLTLFLVLTGICWLALYRHLDSNSKWGQVVGNLVSEWTQILGLVVLSKKLIERGSKESEGR